MCGIAGFWDFQKQLNEKESRNILEKMCDAIAFRGPDHGGYFFEKGVALGHRRLAILDLSESGTQPMHSPSKRYTIIFNGEVYNAPELKIELLAQGFQFRGTSDTEVMLACFEAYGLEQSINKFIGMFAFALYDHHEKQIFLVRDRVGVKPLYFAMQNGMLLFASQPRSFFYHPSFDAKENKKALSAFLSFNYIPSTMCIFDGVEKVQPGEIICISFDASIKRQTYWSLEEASQKGANNPLKFASDHEAIQYLEHLLKDAVHKRMIADVPLGAFLSGGIDSSTVVALMQKNSSMKVKTFSIGFEQSSFNEAAYAKQVAAYIGTDHTEVYIDTKRASEIIQKLPEYFDEPFADSSQIPTYLVSQLARDHVKVALSGDGGDEFFAGYTRYKVCNQLHQIPTFLKKIMAMGIGILPEQAWEKIGSMMPIGSLQNGLGHKLTRIKNVLSSTKEYELFEATHLSFDHRSVKEILGEFEGVFEQTWNRFSNTNFMTHMQLFDAAQYLPDDILTKVDRASMAHGLEAREPLLDHRLIECSFSLPAKYKMRGNQGKWILREVLNRHVPKELFDRPKMGFGVPLQKWLETDLREWTENLLSPTALKENGFENPALILQRWSQLKQGQHNWSYSLWSVLMYQAWQAHYKNLFHETRKG